MKYRTLLFSVVLVGFGILVMVTTLFYASTNGFTGPVQFYETTTSTYTIGFSQGIQAVAVGSSTSTTLTSENLGTLSLFITVTDVIFIPTRNSSLNLLYLLGFLLIGVAIMFPFYALSKRPTTKMKERPIVSSLKEQAYCGHCGSKLPSGSLFCHKCGATVGE